MKILITEQQHQLIAEASKVDILVNKLGFEPNVAEILYNMCGNLAVWLGKKLMVRQKTRYQTMDNVSLLPGLRITSDERSMITSIMDWYRIGLNGNIRPYENNSFDELFKESDEWHKSLNIGDGTINYIEKNEILLDYRKDGIGYYWVDLETNNSTEECNRMGHCGRTSYNNTLVSLREYVKINDKYTLNKSVITGAIDFDKTGKIFQMKGPHNHKPDQKYFPYIIDLILKDDRIKGFGSEYNSADDFSILDLDKEIIVDIYNRKPVLFSSRKLQRGLEKLGIKEPESKNIIIKVNNIDHFISGNFKLHTPSPAGLMKGQNIQWFFESLMDGSYYDMFDDSFYYGWEQIIKDGWLSGENEKLLKDILHNDGSISLISDIEQHDIYDTIKDAITYTYDDMIKNDEYNHIFNRFKDLFTVYGKILTFEDNNITIETTLNHIIELTGVDDDIVGDIDDYCDGDECIAYQLIMDWEDKPKYKSDEYYTPHVDMKEYNKELSERLNNIL